MPRFDRLVRRSLPFLLGALTSGACDNIRVPAPPASVGGQAAFDTAPTRPRRTKPNRSASTEVKYDPGLAAERFDRVRKELRRLVVAEETYYAENGTYTGDLSRIGITPESETELRFLWLSRTGYAVSGTHPGVPGRDCVIYVGRDHGAPTTLKDVRSGREGVPVCDALPEARRPGPAEASASPAPTPSVPDSSSALGAVSPSVQMKVDLRNLVRSQDIYFGLQGVYSKRTEPFALQYLWHRGVTITILSADDHSWSARATHAARPGKSCVIWFGQVTQRPATEVQHKEPDQPVTPACDD
jgi:hypothetical protein